MSQNTLKIKVAYLDTSYIFSGAENCLLYLLKSFDRNHIEPLLIFNFPREHQIRYNSANCERLFLFSSRKWWMGSDYWQNPMRGSDFVSRLILAMKLTYVLKKRKIEIIHINLANNKIFWSVFIPKLFNIKVVIHCRSDTMKWIPNKLIQFFTDGIISVSDFVKNKVKIKYTKSFVTTVYDAIPMSSMQTESVQKIIAKRQLGIDPEIILLSSVGLLVEHKGHDTAIEVFFHLKKYNEKLKLLVAGGGSEDELKRLEKIVQKYDLKGSVIFTQNQIDNIEIVYLASNLIFSLSKKGEAYGLVPFEAISYGIPVLLPNLGGGAEVLKDIYSHLVNPLDVDEIVKKATNIFENYDDIIENIRQTKELLKEKISIENSTNSIQKFYFDLLLK
jgi:glycosyltransferase involved in cell wall biosynthesis